MMPLTNETCSANMFSLLCLFFHMIISVNMLVPKLQYGPSVDVK